MYFKTMFKIILVVFFVQNILAQNGPNILHNLRFTNWFRHGPKLNIAGGYDIVYKDEVQFPWVVSVQKRNEQHVCGGTIITGRHVLTAAHCLDRQPVYQIVAGIDNLNKESKRHVYIIENKIIHPGWEMKTAKNDVGIIMTDNEIDFNGDVKAICMLDFPPNIINKDVYVVGWGLMWENETDKDINQLKEAKSQIKNSSDCHEHGTGLISTFYKSLYCAVLGIGSIMPGDSGSPVMINDNMKNYYLIGAVSETDENFAHFLFISANFYLNWMNNVTSKINEKICVKRNDEIILPDNNY